MNLLIVLFAGTPDEEVRAPAVRKRERGKNRFMEERSVRRMKEVCPDSAIKISEVLWDEFLVTGNSAVSENPAPDRSLPEEYQLSLDEPFSFAEHRKGSQKTRRVHSTKHCNGKKLTTRHNGSLRNCLFDTRRKIKMRSTASDDKFSAKRRPEKRNVSDYE